MSPDRDFSMKKKRYSEEQIICPHCFTKNRTTLMIIKRVSDDKDNESSNAERDTDQYAYSGKNERSFW